MPKSIINQYLDVVDVFKGDESLQFPQQISRKQQISAVIVAYSALLFSGALLQGQYFLTSLILAGFASGAMGLFLPVSYSIVIILLSGIWFVPFLHEFHGANAQELHSQAHFIGVAFIASTLLSAILGHLTQRDRQNNSDHNKQSYRARLLHGLSDSLTHANGDFVKIFSLSGDLLAVNSAGLRQMEAENFLQVKQHDWTSALSEPEIKQFKNLWNGALAEGYSEFNGKFTTVRGNHQYWNVVMTPIRDELNNPMYMLVVTRDFTSQKANKEALLNSNYELNQLFDSLNGLYFGVDSGNTIRYINHKAEMFLNKPKAKLVGYNLFDVLPKPLAEKARECLTCEECPNKPQGCQLFDPDTQRWLQFECSKKNGGANIFITDVTNSVERSLQLQQALASAELAQEIASFATWEYDLTTLRLKFSDGVKELLEIDEISEPGPLVLINRLSSPMDRVKLTRAILSAAKDDLGAYQGGCFSLTSMIIGQSGDTRHVRIALRCIKDTKGLPFKIVGSIQDVSEQKTRELYLKEAELFVRGIIDSLPNQLCVINTEGTLISTNSAWRKFAVSANAQPGTVGRGQNYIKVCEQSIDQGCEDARYVLAGLQNVMEGKSDYFTYEYSMPVDDNTVWFKIHVKPLQTGAYDNGDTDISHEGDLFVISHEDVTEQKQIMQQLETQYRLDVAVSASSEGFWDWNIANGHCYFSAALRQMLKQEADCISGINEWLNAAVHPDDVTNIEQQLESALHYKTSFEAECRFHVHGDGYQWFRLVAKPVVEDKVLTRIVGTIICVEEQHRLIKMLAQSERQFLEMAKHIPDVFWDFNVESQCFNYLSPAYQHNWKLDVPKNKVLSLDWWLSQVVEEDREHLSEHMQNAIATAGNGTLEFRVKHGNERRWKKSTYFAVTDTHGNTQRIVGVASDINNNKATEAELRRLSDFDELTGLPNRSDFMQQLRVIEANPQKFDQASLAFIDIDRFTLLNDSVGCNVGDDLLRQVSVRILNTVRNRAKAFRIAGDEFAILAPSIGTQSELESFLTEIISAFNAPFIVHGHSLFVSVSIGAGCVAEQSVQASDLIRNLDAALLSVKHKGGGGYQVYQQSQVEPRQLGIHIESELRRALEKQEFEVYYQVKVNAESGAPVGCEALLRWNHPERGLVSPVDFIPVLEKSGLILPVGEWLIDQSLHQLKLWHELGYSSLGMAINVSSRQVSQSSFYQCVADTVERYQLLPNLIELELTESAFIAEPELAIELVKKLKTLGVKIAIDDFGTGYSSLNYLRRFSPDTIKIDKSFIDDIEHSEDALQLVEGIVHLSERLRMNVIAEGVETEEQWQLLRTSGCRVLQGYNFAKPLPAHTFEESILGALEDAKVFSMSNYR